MPATMVPIETQRMIGLRLLNKFFDNGKTNGISMIKISKSLKIHFKILRNKGRDFRNDYVRILDANQ